MILIFVSLLNTDNLSNSRVEAPFVVLIRRQPRSMYSVPVASASKTVPVMATSLPTGQRSDVLEVEGILD